jgi:hypothetical protein
MDCDEPMKIKKTQGPEEGSLTVIFGCPVCQRDIALLTNPWETQMLRSMDVKVGGKAVPTEPMSAVRSGLAQKRDIEEALTSSSADRSYNFGAFMTNPSTTKDENAPSCPFSQMVSNTFTTDTGSQTDSTKGEPVWTAEAEKRLERIPGFVKPMVKKGIEMYAKERGYKEITETVMDEAKGKFGM